MVESLKIGKRSVENMKDDDELEMLLGEIPRATSSLNVNPTHGNAHPHLGMDHGHGHTVCVTQGLSGHSYGLGNVHGMYDDEILRHKYASSSSLVSGFSLQSNGSSSSLLSSGRPSFSDLGSPSPPQFDDLRLPLVSGNGFWLDLNMNNGSHLFDDINLSRDFSKMYISGDRGNVSVCSEDIQSCDRRLDGGVHMNFQYGASDDYKKGFSDCGGFSLPVPRGPMRYEGGISPALAEMQHDPGIANFWESIYSPNRSDGSFSRLDFSNSTMAPRHQRTNILANNNFPSGCAVSDASSPLSRHLIGDSLLHTSRNGINLVEPRDALYPTNVVDLARFMPRYNDENILRYKPQLSSGRNKVPICVRVPRSIDEPCAREDTVIIPGEDINCGINRGRSLSMGHNMKNIYHESGMLKSHERRSYLDARPLVPTVQESCWSPKISCLLSLPSKCNSLAEAQGYIYHIAKDQHGCRFLQRMFDEGTSRDVQIIFNEIIDHVVELMMNPFGNYLMQKLLEVCTEEQRMHILLKVTEEPGELVRISLNTHGTRVVQKLIETLKTRQQISLVIAALEPGFLSLIKDLNGNHVVQRCLQCFSSVDSKFIFLATAKYCVEIATHQHGCCVLQRCISHSSGEHRENLISEISANGLLLAQDAFGNYVVQFILELKIPSAAAKLTSQFEGNYVHLSTQKFSSHVVEKCLMVCEEEDRSKIIHELLSATYFEQLLQDPHANYVVQTALRVSEGPLHNSLVDAIESYKAISRNSPYSKRIFSHKLLKK